MGAIRLVPEVDSIGVPVFVAIRGNDMFVPEMDGDLRISSFLEFYNEHGYQLTYDLPSDFHNQPFEIGTSAPIPFWISQSCHVISGDSDKNEPEKMFGKQAFKNPVLVDIARFLDDARSGRIRDRILEWVAEDISNSFADVFFETPVRSRYWVTRYRVAVANARRLTKPPHPIDSKLRTIASEWFRKFGSKTDLSSLCGMLGNSANQILTKRQIADIVFAYFMTKLAQNEWDAVELYARETALHRAFPNGIYGYHIENGWPRVPFHYEEFSDFVERMMDELARGMENERFDRAAKLAFLFFGRARLPGQIETLAETYLSYVAKDFRQLRQIAADAFKRRAAAPEWGYYAESLLNYYNQMMDLDGIINGRERNRRVPFDRRFGVPLEYLRDLRKIKRGDW